MPLRPIQLEIGRLLAGNRSTSSHLAGGAGLHQSAQSFRYSNDLDYFNDREELVATSFAQDRVCLEQAGFQVAVELNQPGYIRAIASKLGEETKIEWAYESAFRFMPPVPHPELGFVLHPIDLAINKVHALAGRDEARDFLDVLHSHRSLLHLGGLCWAAVGKDPGYSPLGLLEQLGRKGRYRPEDFDGLELTESVDLPQLRREWNRALEEARATAERLPPEEAGCLYFNPATQSFVVPGDEPWNLVRHWGTVGGTLPTFKDPNR